MALPSFQAPNLDVAKEARILCDVKLLLNKFLQRAFACSANLLLIMYKFSLLLFPYILLSTSREKHDENSLFGDHLLNSHALFVLYALI